MRMGLHVDQPQVAVAVHRQRDGRMPRELLSNLRMNSPGRKVADERVPQRMEISNTASVIDWAEKR